jgi:hypothetical protein
MRIYSFLKHSGFSDPRIYKEFQKITVKNTYQSQFSIPRNHGTFNADSFSLLARLINRQVILSEEGLGLQVQTIGR